MDVEKQIRALLSYCCRRNTKQVQCEAAIAEIVACGLNAIPVLIDEVIESKWDRAEWAASALGEFGGSAAAAVPALFKRLVDSGAHQEDMFGLAAENALVQIGGQCLSYMRQMAQSNDWLDRVSALGVMLQILPRDRQSFEYFKDCYLNGEEQVQSFLICQLGGFVDFREEALELISHELHSGYPWVRYYSALILGQLKANGELPEKYWTSALSDPDPPWREHVMQPYDARSKARDLPPPE